MSADESSPTINFGAQLGTETSGRELDPETPFRIAIIGDFSGRAQRGDLATCREHLSQLRPRMIDRDNFDQVLQELDVRLERVLLGPDQQSVSLRIEEMDASDPDVLYDKLGVFESLRKLRQRLLNPNTFDGAAEEVMKWNSAEKVATNEPAAISDATEIPESLQIDELLDQILEDAQQDVLAGAGNIELQVDRLISEIAAPYALPAADPRQQDLIECVDAATQTIMLAILQHPNFKQLEADWRALYQLVFELETDRSLKIFLIANVLGRSFTQSGWNLALGEVAEIDNLPVWIYREDGESHAHPCVELWLSEKSLSRVRECGVMPLIAIMHQPAVRMGGFQSVAGTPLKGRWN